jgi:hypothetical protein
MRGLQRRLSFRRGVGTPIILAEVIPDFHRPLQISAEYFLKPGDGRFLLYSYLSQLIIQ